MCSARRSAMMAYLKLFIELNVSNWAFPFRILRLTDSALKFSSEEIFRTRASNMYIIESRVLSEYFNKNWATIVETQMSISTAF